MVDIPVYYLQFFINQIVGYYIILIGVFLEING